MEDIRILIESSLLLVAITSLIIAFRYYFKCINQINYTKKDDKLMNEVLRLTMKLHFLEETQKYRYDYKKKYSKEASKYNSLRKETEKLKLKNATLLKIIEEKRLIKYEKGDTK